MTELEQMEINAELKAVEAARINIEVRIYKLNLEIKSLKDHIEIQVKKEEELKQKLKSN